MLLYLLYFVLLVVALSYAWWFYFTSTMFYKLCNKIPGPKTLPIIGNCHQVFGNPEQFTRNIMKLSDEYYPICRVLFINQCFVFIRDADDINTLLTSRKCLSKALGYEAVAKILGNGLLTANVEIWKNIRRIANPAFSIKAVKTYIGTFNDESFKLVSLLKHKADGKQFDIYETVSMATLQTVLKTSFGTTTQNLEIEELQIMVSAIKKGKSVIQKCISYPWYCLDFLYKVSGLHRQGAEAVSASHSAMEKVINNQNNSSTADDSKTKFSGFIDYVYQYMKENKETLEMDDIKDNILTVAVGATDTSAFTMSVCLMLLGLHKDIQDKVFEEIKKVCGEDLNRSVEYKDLQSMIFTEQVIKETLRLFSAGYIIGRKLDEDVELDGYIFPARTNVIVSPFLLHRDPKYFADPLRFDPGRFSPENSVNRHPHCFIPFSSGSRLCIGHYYAMLQMKITIYHLIRNFEILPGGSREEMEDVNMSMLLSLKHGYKVRMKPRNS